MEVNIDGKAAVVALDVFKKIWCKDKEKTERAKEPAFRCGECSFRRDDGKCSVNIFWVEHAPEYEDFGAMSH